MVTEEQIFASSPIRHATDFITVLSVDSKPEATVPHLDILHLASENENWYLRITPITAGIITDKSS